MKPIIKFQSTHPRRVWHNFYFLLSLCTCFNPHTHAGCDSGRRAMRDAGSGFNPHTHAGCDITVLNSRPSNQVSIHTPTQGVTEGSSKVIIMDSSFNPHTHAGCDHGRAGGGVLPGMVSIHTPTQGVTISAQAFNKAAIVSIHTPTQGVTGRAIRLHPNKTVSIHTPTQGVTNGIFAFMGRRDVSIHTPTQGVTYLQNSSYQV